jgi:hypothetical protein
MINGMNVYISGAQVVAKTVGAIRQTSNFVFAGDTNGALASNTAYYIYYMSDNNIWISTIAPNPEGNPSSAISTQNGGIWKIGSQEGVFLGSFVTDDNANIIPFERMGDEVVFLLSTQSSHVEPNNGHSFGWTSTTGKFPNTQKWAVGMDTMTPIPSTATWAIVDWEGATTRVSGQANFAILDPNLLPAPGDQDWYPVTSAQAAKSLPDNRRHVRVPVDKSGNIYVGDVAQPPANVTDTATIYYIGYVEAVQHLGN